MRRGIGARWGALAAVLMAAACHHGGHEGRVATAGPAALAPPQPPAGSGPGLVVPEPGRDGRYVTINSGITAQEALWHVRAALNVAALSCRTRPGGAAIVKHYNALLVRRKAALARAYAAESGRFARDGKGAVDAHQTRLYNFFAQPSAQAAFCQAAADVAEHVEAVSPDGLPQYATGALGRLETPILDYYRAYDVYRHELAAWNARTQTRHAERQP